MLDGQPPGIVGLTQEGQSSGVCGARTGLSCIPGWAETG